jgi:hypothetical protein
MKSDALYVGMVAVFILLALGIALYAWGSLYALWEDLDLIGVAGCIVLYILLGKDQSLRPRRVGIEPSKTTR